jgi:arabinose-5-phosphate isomerase
MSERAANLVTQMDDGHELTVFGKRFFREQSESLKKVALLLDDSFSEAVDVLCRRDVSGRVLTSGVGKAGHIARKIAATLSSVGVPAFFVSPGDTGHGDFGCFCNSDVILLFSHSGESAEICRILDYISDSSSKSILITGCGESSAARASDVVLSYGAVAESGLHGLAPTTSTTLMLVMGDALALTAAHRAGLTRDDFARHHPGGSLGRSLVGVEVVMRSGSRHCVVNISQTTREVIQKYESAEGRPGAVSVVDEAGRLVGVFTDGDLRRCVVRGLGFLDEPIGEHMTKNPITVLNTQTAAETLEVLCARKIDQVVVVDCESRPVGMVDIQDIVRTLG